MPGIQDYNFLLPLLQNNNVTPTGRWILTLEIMLDGIGKDISFALAILLSVLLAELLFSKILKSDTVIHCGMNSLVRTLMSLPKCDFPQTAS